MGLCIHTTIILSVWLQNMVAYLQERFCVKISLESVGSKRYEVHNATFPDLCKVKVKLSLCFN